MIWEKLFGLEKLCLWLSKFSTGMQDPNLRSIMHVIAEMEWVHSSVTIATRTFKFIPNIPLLWSYKAINNPFSCYDNRVMMSFHFSNGMQCMPCSWDFHHTYQCKFWKVKDSNFLIQIIFLKSINSLFIPLSIDPANTLMKPGLIR